MTVHLDLASVRLDFPVNARMLYLDSAHQTPLATSVRAALDAFYNEANETAGPKVVWLRRVEEIRERVATLLGASADELAFTKNTSEGLNIAANAIPLRSGDNVLMVEGDHLNNVCAWLNLARKGVEVRFIKLESEVANAEMFAPYVDDRTRVICLSHVTFHAGHRHDLKSIGELCARRGLYFVVDAMQSVGVIPVDVKALGISMLAAGCHKGLLVPQGLGILYVDNTLDELQPAYLAMAGLANPSADLVANPKDLALRKGAGRFELGNLNLSCIHALSAALDIVTGVGVDQIEKHILALGDRLITHIDPLGIKLVGPRTRANRAHIYVLDLPANQWLDYFSQNQVRVSPEREGIRISFGVFNTLGDVDQLASIIRRHGDKEKSNDP